MSDELYSTPQQVSQHKHDSEDYRYIALSKAEFVPNLPRDIACVYKSDTAIDNVESFPITPSWLKDCILDEDIKAKTAPFLLCFAGLPDSKKSTALNELMKHHFGLDIYNDNNERGIRCYDLAAVRRPPKNEIMYANAKLFAPNGYVLVVESAIEYLLRVRGHTIKNASVLPSANIHFNDKELNSHLISAFSNLTKLTCKNDSKEILSIWSQSLASGISMINIWDIGLNKAVFYILPHLAGLLYNCWSWVFFDLIRDFPHLYDLPDIPPNRYDPSRNDSEVVMRWRARIHYLLRFAKLSQSNQNSSNVCKLIATYKSELASSNISKDIEEFKKEADMVSTQMKVKNLVDTEDVIEFSSDNEDSMVLKKLLDDIVHSQFQKSIDIPLSFIFLRSFFYTSSDESITKEYLKQKASVLNIKDKSLEDFCKLFTSFGSIIDVSLIDSSSSLIILKPADFFHKLDKLFYPSADIDPLVTKYGIVTMTTTVDIFGSDKASIVMSFLTSIGLAVKLPSTQFSINIYDNYAYYVPNVCTARPIQECEPKALHLLRDINIPMSHIKVKFTSFILKEYPSTILEISEEPHINVTKFRAFPFNSPSHQGVVFDLVYLGDAIEFRFPITYDQSCMEEICTLIITVCHKIMPLDVKYNFAVMCSDDPNPNDIYKLRRNRHLLPDRELCANCRSIGRHENDLLKIWNTVLSKDANKVPQGQILNGDPLTLDDAVCVAKEMSNLSQETLDHIADHLSLSKDIFLIKQAKQKLCLKMIFAWEDMANKKEEDSSKRELAIKLMNVANFIHKVNKDESKKLEGIARSLNFRVACSMSIR